jgi:predicted nucleic acid-binding protein
MILVDTNVLLDLVVEDPKWATWSQEQLESASLRDRLKINPIIYAELSMAFSRIEEVEAILFEASVAVEPIPREALFLAGKVFISYRKRSGIKQGVLPYFFIGAHAAVTSSSVLTRDAGRYRTYFPSVPLIAPE